MGLVLGLGLLAAGCVPRGDPPAGRQVLAGRNSLPFGIVRSNGDGTTRILFVRDGQTDGSMDLYVLWVDGAGGPPVERLLAASAFGNPYGGCGYGSPACFQTDAGGRLLVFTGAQPPIGGGNLLRVDPITGDQTDLGGAAQYVLSPDGQRLLVYPLDRGGPATLYESDDRAVPLLDVTQARFEGEVLYYTTKDKVLMRLAPGGSPEMVATAVDSFLPYVFDDGVLIVLGRATASPIISTYTVLDAATLQETPLPTNTNGVDFSPDGRWLVTIDYMAGAITFTDWRTGAEDVFRPDPWPRANVYQWRPGHVELWLPNDQTGPPATWIKKPGVDPIEVPGIAGVGATMFTPDGAYWFSQADATGNQPTVVGSADDPTGPRFVAIPAHMVSGGTWQLPDGRLVLAAWNSTPELDDVYLVDPTTGDSHVVGEQGAVLGVGRTRLLVNQHIIHGGGDLTVFDVATARATVIASEFAMTAVIEPQDADDVAPGAALAFRFQARFPSPYDGIWLTTVP